jgi:hypothetical protein
VKFAKYEPIENELRELHSAALRLVKETTPQIEAPTSGKEQTVNPQSAIATPQ